MIFSDTVQKMNRWSYMSDTLFATVRYKDVLLKNIYRERKASSVMPCNPNVFPRLFSGGKWEEGAKGALGRRANISRKVPSNSNILSKVHFAKHKTFCVTELTCCTLLITGYFVFSVARKRRGPLKHIKFGTNIDVSDERKWVWLLSALPLN